MARFIGTAKTDAFFGGADDDVFVFRAADLSPRDRLSGGGGTDIVAIQNTGSDFKTFTSAGLRGLSNIDAILLDAAGGYGFTLVLDDAFAATNREARVTIASSNATGPLQWLHVDAARVTKMSFTIAGTVGAQDQLRTGGGNDVFVYRGDALNVRDVIDGGRGTDTLVLAGAGATRGVKDGKPYTDPNGRTSLADIRNVEKVVVTELAKGQSRTIEFGNLAGTATYAGTGTIEIATDRNYGTGKPAAAIDGVLVVDGHGLKATQGLRATGGNAADRLTGGAAADVLNGGGGNDTLQGGLGADRLSGGNGSDVFLIGDGLARELARDGIDGGAGLDTLRFSTRKAVSLSAADLAAATVTNVEAIAVSEMAPSVSLTFDKDFLTRNHDAAGFLTVGNGFAFAGDRSLTLDASLNADASVGLKVALQGPGTEHLKGGAGNDLFDYSKVLTSGGPDGATMTLADTVDGGAGRDTIRFAEGAVAHLGTGVTKVETVQVVAGATAERTEINLAVKGAIAVDGSALGASDTLIVRGQVADTGSDPGIPPSLFATGPLTIRGGAGADTLVGGRGADTISGGAGSDVIAGRAGADALRGGAGADTFYYLDATDSTVAKAGRDTILDFSRTDGDRIGFLHVTTPPFAFIEDAAFHGVRGELRSVVEGASTFVQLDLDGNRQADLQIEIAGKFTLTAADFIL